MENWIYVGLFLDDKSKKFLKRLYSIPKGWKEYYDHMTVVFNDGSQFAEDVKSVNEKHFHKRLTLKVIAVGISEKAMALKVELPGGVVCANKIPHITLGTSLEGKPVDSNDITNWHNIGWPFTVIGSMHEFINSETSTE
jgi:hypothetical protein